MPVAGKTDQHINKIDIGRTENIRLWTLSSIAVVVGTEMRSQGLNAGKYPESDETGRTTTGMAARSPGRMPRVASGGLRQARFQPCAAEQPNGQVRRGQHGNHPEECSLGGRRSMQVIKTAKDIEGSQRE